VVEPLSLARSLALGACAACVTTLCALAFTLAHGDRYGRRNKPPLSPTREFGGSAFWVLHRDFVSYVWGCLDWSSVEPPLSELEAVVFPAVAELREANGLKADAREGDQPAERVAREGASEEDAAYCKSVRGIYQWMSTAYDPAETFLHTVLHNGPYCDRIGRSNLHWVSWDPAVGDQQCNVRWSPGFNISGDYPNRRPGCITTATREFPRGVSDGSWSVENRQGRFCAEINPGVTGGARCATMEHQLFARKFSTTKPHYSDALDVADSAAASWDAEMERGLLSCQGGSTAEATHQAGSCT